MISIDKKKAVWNEFMAKKGTINNVFKINCMWDSIPKPPMWPDKKEERIEWIYKNYEKQLEKTVWLHDDSIPHLDMITGTEIFAEAFGCKVNRPSNNNPYALPLITDASEVLKLTVPDLWNSSLTILFEMADKLQEKAGKDAIFRLPDIQSPMDIAALIWDRNYFYIALIEEPDAVKELSQKTFALLADFLTEWFKRYGKSFVAHYPTYYMEQGLTLSEDEIGSVSQSAFKEFFLPELIKLSELFGGMGMHSCANSRHQWENFKLIPNLKLLNLVRPADILLDAYEFFADTTAQYHSWSGYGRAWTWRDQLPESAKFVIETTAKTKQEAVELAEKISESINRSN